jgi:hypothetical protein
MMKIESTVSRLIFQKVTLTFSLSLGLALGIVFTGEKSTVAQITQENEPVKYQSNERSTFGDSGNGFNPIDMIHRTNLSRSRGQGEFEEDTQKNLNDAANQFKRMQQERLRNQQSQSTENRE